MDRGGDRGRPALDVGVAAPDAPPAETGLSTVFGIRILARLGPARLTGLFGLLFWVGAMVWLPMTLRPDLIRPADLGSDTSNYAAAGERLAQGSDLYALQAGDRPVPADNPPEWSVPILSPPAVGVLWAPLTLLPQPFELYTSWTVGLACTVALGVFLVLRLRPLLVVAILAPLMVLTLVAWSGNLYALLAPAFALTWWLSVRERSRESEWLVGAIIGAATVLKLGPAVLLVWLLAGRRTNALASAAVTGLVSVAVAIWLGGVGIFRTYLDVVLHSAGTPAPLSIPGLLAGLGLPATVGRLGLLVVVALGCLAVVLLRRDPRRSFAVAVVLSLFATTVVRPETLVVALVALMPWATHDNAPIQPMRGGARSPMLAISAGVAAIAVALSVTTGGLRSSSMTLVNDTAAPVVVRFTVPSQDATFGFRLQPGEAGTGWLDRIGTVFSPVYVTTASCDLLYQFDADPGVTAMRIGPDAAVAVEQPAAAFLDYAPDCAEVVARTAAGSR